MMNFMDNAIYYSNPEGGSVEISLHKTGNNVMFKVRDHGIGVPDEEKHSLFTKFYRATNAKKARPDGNGVGLYVARKIILVHGGQLIFESKAGKGSTFGFKIPIS
jgi:signal transduction histidine kinase